MQNHYENDFDLHENETAFSLPLNLAEEVNRHFLENDYGDLSFFLSF